MADIQAAPVPAASSPVSGRSWSMWKKGGFAALVVGALVGIWWITSQTGHKKPDTSALTGPAGAVGDVGGSFMPAVHTPPPNPAATPASSGALSPPTATTGPAVRLPGIGGGQTRVAPISAFQAQAASVGGTGTAPVGSPGASQAAALQPQDDTAVATMLPDRNLFLTMGTPMPCITEQPIRTDVPGPFRCKVPEPVFSTSGKVPLLDRGTWIFGQIREPLGRGSSRAFAVVTRLETPQGCLVKLQAPVGDQIGTAGIDGEIDTHFWQRFQGIAMIALLDAVSQTAAIAAANALSGGSKNGNSLSFNQFQGMGQQVGRGTFDQDVNIPPTLSTPQARNLVVMSMQDVDMRPCFKLRTINR